MKFNYSKITYKNYEIILRQVREGRKMNWYETVYTTVWYVYIYNENGKRQVIYITDETEYEKALENGKAAVEEILNPAPFECVF